MIDANYHAHTRRCKHAAGSEREYIESAIRNGFKIFGFSDHTPQPYENGFVSPIRMDMSELDGYVDTLKRLREEYADRIEIKIGLEAEYFPEHFDKLMREVRKRDIDYLILGQHYVPDEEYGFYSGSPSGSKERLEEYVDEVIDALETGEFMYLAHPDLIHFTGPEDIYLSHMKRLCEYARDNRIPLELNALGLMLGKWYPVESFFRMAAGMGCQIIYGCDAHSPEQVVQPEGIRGMMDFIETAAVKLSFPERHDLPENAGDEV